MIKIITSILFVTTIFGQAQEKDTILQFNNFTTTELQLGLTLPSNKGFPQTGLQKSIALHFGKHQINNNIEWIYMRVGLEFFPYAHFYILHLH